MNDFNVAYKPFNERSILIEWPQDISHFTLKNVLNYKQKIENHYIKEKVYIKSAYNSILITYNFTINNFYNEILTLKSIYNTKINVVNEDFKLWKIPVCYNQEFGLDLEELSNISGLNISDIINLHSSTIYSIYFIGFLPGFLYLGGLDSQLNFPRKKSPRLNIKKGAVAIGGQQTGIYPNMSPGGWNIIGNTPLDFFNISLDKPCFAKPGDKIQFVPISRLEYNQIKNDIEYKDYSVESEVING